MIYHSILRMLVLCCSLLLVACGSPTTPSGSIGTFNLRSSLPADVQARAPTDASAAEYQAEVTVGEPAAKVLIRWRVFQDGPNMYILATSFEVLEAAQGLELKASVGAPINAGSSEAVVAAHPVSITWSSSAIGGSKSGTVSGRIVATGAWQTN
jgi:uncharacterized membrane protein